MAWPETVRKTDLRIEFIRGSGPGGQHRNKRDTACRMTHIPTGTVGYAEDERSQAQNKKLAFRRLAAKLVPLMKAAAKGAEVEQNTARVRNYHGVDNRVQGMRLPGKVWRYDDVLHGDALGEIIDELEKS